MTGCYNKLLDIDLARGNVGELNLDPTEVRTYIGGSALAAWLFFKSKGYQQEPLAPESPLFIMTGPLVGTTFPGSSRFVMAARSPQTGIWGESASGGSWGAQLKKAGFDGLRILGKADKPVYILIEDEAVSIVEAGDLWGQDTYDAVDTLRANYDGKGRVRVLTIGPAGENLVKFASVCNDKAHYFGRTGMGAVMGAKNLKAVVVRGTGKPPVNDREAYNTARKAAVEAMKGTMITDSFHELGTAAAMDMGSMTGDVPIKNWSIGEEEDIAAALGGPAMSESIITGRSACFACPIGCKPVVEVTEKGYEVPKGPGPEYETAASFGTMLMNGNLAAVAKANELCNRYGLDTISCGSTLAFIMEAYERGHLTRDDLGGLDMTWGNIDAALELISQIAHRQGFGQRAAEGSAALAREIGDKAAEYLVTVKGLELPMHDPRAFHGQGLSYMNSNRGACHLQHSDQAVEQGMVSWPELGLEEDYDAQESQGKARLVYISENIGQMANAVCVCHFCHWAMGNENLLNGFNAVTGYGFCLEDLLEAGQRAWVLKRALNNLMGVTGADDKLPERVLTVLTDGGAEGSSPDETLMKNEYYETRGLDEKGFPKPGLLSSLGLDFISQMLHG